MNEKEKMLGQGNIVNTILKLSVPLIISQLVNVLYNIVDRIYIGNIPGTGKEALAGLGVTFPIITIITAFASLFGMGGSPIASIRIGEGKHREARNIMVNSCFMLILSSIILTIVVITFDTEILYLFGAKTEVIDFARDYLVIYAVGTISVLLTLGLTPYVTAQGYSNIAMFATLLGAIMNIVLDPIFIYLLNLGVKGAAFATIISQTASALFIITFLCSKTPIINLSFRSFKPNYKIILGITALGVSPFIMSITDSLVQICFNFQIKKYGGAQYVLYINVITIALSLKQFMHLPLSGLSNGSTPIIGFNYGAGYLDRVRKTVRILITVSLAYSLAFYLLIFLIPGYLTRIFNSNPELLAMSPRIFRIFFIGFSIFGIQIACQSIFIALKQSLISIFLACLRKLVLLIPLVMILPYYFEIDGIFYAEAIADTLAVISTFTVFTIAFRKILKKRIEKELSL